MNNSVDRTSIIESRHGPSTGTSAYSPPNPPEVWASARPRDGPVHPAHQPVLQSSLLLLLVLPLASLSLELSPPFLIPQHPRGLAAWGPRQPSSVRGQPDRRPKRPHCWPWPTGRSAHWASLCADPASCACIRAAPSHSACPASGAQLDNCCASAVTRASQRPS